MSRVTTANRKLADSPHMSTPETLSTGPRSRQALSDLVAEFVVHLRVDLPRVIPVKAAEGQAVVDQQVTVRHVQYGQRRGKALSPRFACAQVQLGVARQMTRGCAAAVGEPRADVHIGGGKRLARQVRVEPDIRRIALVMIEREEAGGRTEIGKSSVDRAVSVGCLIGIGQVGLTDAPELGRTNGELVALNQRAVDRQGYERVRVADVVVIEEILRLGVEVIGIDYPALNGDRDADLIFLVALAVQAARSPGCCSARTRAEAR